MTKTLSAIAQWGTLELNGDTKNASVLSKALSIVLVVLGFSLFYIALRAPVIVALNI